MKMGMETKMETTTLEDIKMMVKLNNEDPKYIELYELLQSDLKGYKFKVKFIKNDGTIRDMNCTKNSYFIHKYFMGDIGIKVGTDQGMLKDMKNKLVKVFDIDKKDFRSFKLERVIEIELTEKF